MLLLCNNDSSKKHVQGLICYAGKAESGMVGQRNRGRQRISAFLMHFSSALSCKQHTYWCVSLRSHIPSTFWVVKHPRGEQVAIFKSPGTPSSASPSLTKPARNTKKMSFLHFLTSYLRLVIPTYIFLPTQLFDSNKPKQWERRDLLESLHALA